MQLEPMTSFPKQRATNSVAPGVFNLELQISCILGVNKHERNTPQKINIILNISAKKTTQKNILLKDTKNLIQQLASTEQPFLIERMCYSIATALMSKFADIGSLTLTIQKPEALRYAKHAYVTIRIERKVEKHGPQKNSH
jgi:FolB domain-containing protein